MPPFHRVVPRSSLVTLACLFWASTAWAQVQSSNQQKCINGLNKSGVKVALTQAKEGERCLKNAAKGLEPDAQGCLTDDANGKVLSAENKTVSTEASKCTEAPDFGKTDAATVNAAAVDEQVELVADLFAADLTAAVISSTSDPDGAKCQSAILKSTRKLGKTLYKAFLGCKKNGLASAIPAEQIDSPQDLAGCFDTLTADVDGKIGKQVTKLTDTVGTKCTEKGVDLTAAFPGMCTVGTRPFADCVAKRVRCHACLAIDAWDSIDALCDGFDDGLTNNASCGPPLLFAETITIPNGVEPDETPGSPGVVVTNPKLITQFGGTGFSLNNSRYTRWRLNGPAQTPDAILVVVAGFGGGANNFKILAENMIERVREDHGLVLEVWGFHRRSNQLEDREGVNIAAASKNALVALDWYYGAELGLTLHPDLVAGPNRRAVFYNTSSDIPFLANWTPLVYSRDLDVVIEEARTVVANDNVFLGGHSLGTGFVARYAATDFDFTGLGPAQPGYQKIRGLVLWEGSAGNTSGAPLTADSLDRIEAKFDGGLFGAVRDQAGRCVDGTTACTIADEATTCMGQSPPKCTLQTNAYTAIAGLTPQVTAASQPAAIQAIDDPDGGQVILQVDQGSGSAIDTVPALSILSFLQDSTAFGLAGQFLDDDGVGALLSPAVATSMGQLGPVVSGLRTWIPQFDGTQDAFHGPPPTTLPGNVWGDELEVTRIERFIDSFIADGNSAADWYFSTSGLTTTSAPGVCTTGTCTAGNVGAGCSTNADCAQAISLDSTALSVGRGRRDIENLTQAAGIDIPVISFGGSNGLTPVPGIYVPFGLSIATCTAPSCSGVTPRVVNATSPNPAFPTFGDVAGGYEVHISVGFAHNDVVTAEDIPENNVLAPLSDFIARNVQ